MADRVLFLDPGKLDLCNVSQRLGQAEKFSGNPVLRVGLAHDPDGLQVGWPHTSMFDDEEGVWKMWYTSQGHERPHAWNKAYAVSEDGIVWSKPRLGIHAYRGSRENNLVALAEEGPVALGPVFRDPGETDPAARYKSLRACARDGEYHADNPLLLAKRPVRSPDGFHWEVMSDDFILAARWPALVQPRPAPCPPEGHIDVHQVLYDPDDPNDEYRYRFYGQTFGPEPNESGRWHRQFSVATAPRFGPATLYPQNPILDIVHEHEIHFGTVFKTSGWYILFHEYAVFESVDGRYSGDIRISVSPDGFNFRRLHPSRPILPRGETSEWDSGFTVTPSDVVEHDNRLWIYYSAGMETWQSWPGRAAPGFEVSPGAVQSREIGLAWMRPDGFVYLACDDELIGGKVTTEPIAPDDAAGRELTVGLDRTQIRRSWLQAEVLDAETGSPICGYAPADSRRQFTGGLDVPMRWNGADALPSLPRPVRLRFHLFGRTRLHSYRLA